MTLRSLASKEISLPDGVRRLCRADDPVDEIVHMHHIDEFWPEPDQEMKPMADGSHVFEHVSFAWAIGCGRPDNRDREELRRLQNRLFGKKLASPVRGDEPTRRAFIKR